MNDFKKMKMYTDEKYVGTAAFVDTSFPVLSDMTESYFSGFSAVVFTPCSRISTSGMEYPVDVIFADRENRVLRIDYSVPPDCIIGEESGAVSVIELKEMNLFSMDITVGSIISFKPL